ncbi:MAG: glycoside hydrolase family 31 protein [Dehalococcoidales bacterium]|nr:glycoside hydrolase family 31 protein [Dehalococcoidales bacterium]
MQFNRERLAAQKGFQRLEALSFQGTTSGKTRFLTQAGWLEITFHTPGIIRLRLEARPQTDYGLLASPLEPVAVRQTTRGDGYRLEAMGLTLELVPDPLRLCLERNGQVILESATDMSIEGELQIAPFARGADQWLVSLALRSGEPVYGLGEKFGPLNHRGQMTTSWNADALGVNAEASYKNVPFAWSPEGWGILVHTPARVAHGIGHPPWSHRSYILQVDDPNLDIFLLAGDTPADIIRQYTLLTGRSPLPPRWSYGTWMSRCYYRTAEEALQVARTLRARSIPCDVLVLDGRAWHKPEYRFDFKWDADRYPDPESFIRELNDLGLRLCLWEYPYISVRNRLFAELAEKGYLLRSSSGEALIHKWLPEPFESLVPQLQPSGIVDLTNPDAYTWYRDAHRDLFAMGVSAMKTDFGEAVPEDAVAHNGDTGKRLHNVYPLLYNRCASEATDEYGKDGTVVWGRSGWIGSQRYPIQWGGDPSCDWEGLAASIRGGLSWGMSGGPFYSHDVGGFSGAKPDSELYVRWAQAGVMSSHIRFHGTSPREPWEYGEEAERIVRRWLEWRYRLIPYLEACALEAHQTGIPVARAMPLVFPRDILARSIDEQYMLGPALLVAPVVRPGGKVSAYLPEDGWYDLWSEQRLEGPRALDLVLPLDRIMIYGREGFILPLGPAVQHTGELDGLASSEEVWVFGRPRHGLDLPGLSLEAGADDQGRTVLKGVPQGVKVRHWGNLSAEHHGDRVIFGLDGPPNDMSA